MSWEHARQRVTIPIQKPPRTSDMPLVGDEQKELDELLNESHDWALVAVVPIIAVCCDGYSYHPVTVAFDLYWRRQIK